MRLKGLPPPLILGLLAAFVLAGCNGIDVEDKPTAKVDTDANGSEQLESSEILHEQVQTGIKSNEATSTNVQAGVHSSVQTETGTTNDDSTVETIEKSSVEELKTTSSVVATPSLPSHTGLDDVLVKTETDKLKDKVEASKPVIQISKTVDIAAVSDVHDSPVHIESSVGEAEGIPMPMSFPKDDLDGYEGDFENDEKMNDKQKYYKNMMGKTTYVVVPTADLQAIDMTSPVYDQINPNRVGLIEETTDDADSFLVNPASLNKLTGGPLNPARFTQANDQDRQRNTRQSGQQNSPLKSPAAANGGKNADASGGSPRINNDESLEKRGRIADRDDEGPKINDILSGLLSVVGEGLSFATNYVQEQNKRKQQPTPDPDSEPDLSPDQELSYPQPDQSDPSNPDSLFPSRNRTRVNNRGPPKLTGIPFEAIPLEVLGNKLPSSNLIPQRPFQTRIPPGGSRPVPPPGQYRPPGPAQYPPSLRPRPRPQGPQNQGPQNQGPQNQGPLKKPPRDSLFPTRDKPSKDTDESTNSPLPTRPNYEPGFLSPPPRVNISDIGDIPDTSVAELAAEIAIIESILKGNAKFTTERSITDSGTTNDITDTTNDNAGETIPDRINILQNNLFSQSTTTSTPKTSQLTTPKKGSSRPTTRNTPKRPTAVITAVNPSGRPQQQKRPYNNNNNNNNNGGRPLIDPSYNEPSILVTPPPNDRNRKPPFNRRRPPPRPSGQPPSRPTVQRPLSAVPTPALPGRPYVFPTRPLNEEIVTGIAIPQRNEIVTGVAIPADNNVFDLTVTAQQNFGGKPKIQNVNSYRGIITQAQPGDDYVSIDGKRTYFDIGPGRTQSVENSRTAVQQLEIKPTKSLAGKGSVIGATRKIGGEDVFKSYGGTAVTVKSSLSSSKGQITIPLANDRRPGQVSPGINPAGGQPSRISNIKPGPTRRPQAPPVRIDTCIVGDNNTCKAEYHEVCLTMLGVSSCYCKPGYGRKHHRHKCKRTVKLLMSVKLDRMKDKPLIWNSGYMNPDSDQYQILEGEASYAIDSAMSLTSLGNLYMGAKVNTFYPLSNSVTVNTTLELLENGYTTSNLVKRDLEKKLVDVIQARGNNIGDGNLYVAGLYNPIPEIKDLDECEDPLYNDCGENSVCINTFGAFICECKRGYGDRYAGDKDRSGRECETCPDEFCNSRGSCSVLDGDRVCQCTGNYYGDQCEVDGEVLAVAVGASVAAVIIILLTLVCLCMWSRRWKREQEKVELSRGYSRPFIVGTLPPPPTYHTKMPPAPNWVPPAAQNIYGTRWPDAQQNIYASVMFHGSSHHSQEPLYMSPGSGLGHPSSGPGHHEPIYMSPLEPPLSVYGGANGGGTVSSVGGVHSLYGTMPRHRGSGGTLDIGGIGSQFTANNFPTQYATFRKDRLGARPSLRSLGLMEEEEDDKVRVLEDMEGDPEVESSSSDDDSMSMTSLKEKLKDENLSRITRGITFQTLRSPHQQSQQSGNGHVIQLPAGVKTSSLHIQTKASLHSHQYTAQPEPGIRRMGPPPQQTRKIPIIRTGLPPPPISTIPRPNTSMGNRTGSHPLLDTSESEETEASASKIPRPRSSMLMGTVNLEDDFETDYPRFSGTIGVRNPRFVAAMRNAYVQQQHIQMNMMNRFK